MVNQSTIFLSQSYKDIWDDYMRSLTRENFPCWDYIILTASNEESLRSLGINTTSGDLFATTNLFNA